MTEGRCGICGASEWLTAYEGPVRDGVFGRSRPGRVLQCQHCGVEVLIEPRPVDHEYYAGDSYRTDVGEGADAQSFLDRHDREQFGRLSLLQRVPLRGRVVADVGCGGGSFLDLIRGYASLTIGVEPARAYHESLVGRGHRVYADTASALRELKGTVDVVTCFSVIEHVEDPVELLAHIRELLAPSGTALVSTPNRGDVLMRTGLDAYRCFFYRAVHRYYFDRQSLAAAASRAGFTSCETVYRHRFPFSNFVGWLRDRRPTGHDGESALGSSFDRIWVDMLEETGRADYLYAFLRSGGSVRLDAAWP